MSEMKSAEKFVEEFFEKRPVICVETSNLVKIIEARDNEVLEHAAGIVRNYTYQKGSMNFNMGFLEGKILAARTLNRKLDEKES